MELRSYQKEDADRLEPILRQHGIAIYTAQSRLGKTLVSAELVRRLGCRRVAFLTKPKAQPSARKDYAAHVPEVELQVYALQSLHKLQGPLDLVVIDEHHKLAAFDPRPNLMQKRLRKLLQDTGALVVLLSATPTPEGLQGWYRPLWCCPRHTWASLGFWQWVGRFVNFATKTVGVPANRRKPGEGPTREVPDFSGVREGLVSEVVAPLQVSRTQESAGFSTEVVEEEVHLQPGKRVLDAIGRATRGLLTLPGWPELRLGAGAVRMSKAHQLAGGTCLHSATALVAGGRPGKKEDLVQLGTEKRVLLDAYKANYLLSAWGGRRIAVLYQYQAERDMLEAVLSASGKWRAVVDTPEQYAATPGPAVFLGQTASCSEGVRLDSAEALLVYSLGFSASQYWQLRERLSDFTRQTAPRVIFLLGEGTLDPKVLAAVRAKKDYTLRHFRADFPPQKSFSGEYSEGARWTLRTL